MARGSNYTPASTPRLSFALVFTNPSGPPRLLFPYSGPSLTPAPFSLPPRSNEQDLHGLRKRVVAKAFFCLLKGRAFANGIRRARHGVINREKRERRKQTRGPKRTRVGKQMSVPLLRADRLLCHLSGVFTRSQPEVSAEALRAAWRCLTLARRLRRRFAR